MLFFLFQTQNHGDVLMSFNSIELTNHTTDDLDRGYSNCNIQIESNCEFKEDEKVLLNNKDDSFKAKVKKTFKLLIDNEISTHAWIIINDKALEEFDMIVKASDLKKINIEDCYIVKSSIENLEEGLIFSIIKYHGDSNELILFSRDLDKPIPNGHKIVEIISKQKNEEYLIKIDENIAKHLYPIKPHERMKLMFNKQDLIKSIEELKENTYIRDRNVLHNHHIDYGFIHKKVEIGGCFFYLIHVNSLIYAFN